MEDLIRELVSWPVYFATGEAARDQRDPVARASCVATHCNWAGTIARIKVGLGPVLPHVDDIAVVIGSRDDAVQPHVLKAVYDIGLRSALL